MRNFIPKPTNGEGFLGWRDGWREEDYLDWLDKTKDLNIIPIPYSIETLSNHMKLDWVPKEYKVIEVVDKETIWLIGHMLKDNYNGSHDLPYISGMVKLSESLILDDISIVESMVIDFVRGLGFELSLSTDVNGYYGVLSRGKKPIKVLGNSNRTKLGLVRIFEKILKIITSI